MTLAWVGVGGNLDDPRALVLDAIRRLGECADIRVMARSSLYRTEPVGYAAQGDFVNAVVRVETRLNPEELLDMLQGIEKAMGRDREGPRYGPRRVDLDLLMFDAQVLGSESLTLPHPRMHERRFVLEPLVEIDPDLAIPGKGRADRLLEDCLDQRVSRIGTWNQ
jgi:2-amino-4-hydroxy-6-hydroxymethyldihydropteridine diphosphokinase